MNIRQILKIQNILLLIFVGIMFLSCKPRITYPLPKNISKESKKNLTAYWKHGRDLYKENCSGCHGIFGKSKDSIPDFSQQQLDTYKAKLSITDADNHGIAQKLSYEDIEAILHFLSYKKIRK